MRVFLAVILASMAAAFAITREQPVSQEARAPSSDPAELPPVETAEEIPSEFIPGQTVPVGSGTSIFETAVDAVKDTFSGGVAIFGTKYDSLIKLSAEQAGIPWQTLWRLIWKESRFREDIISGAKKSPTGALGIAQFMPPTAREWLGSEANALNPNIAIPGAARYLAWLARKFGGDMTKAVAAYNWGIGNVQRQGLSAAPAETRDYVAAILGEKIV
jgi:soluble lytic murein transglycosylase-like protein